MDKFVYLFKKFLKSFLRHRIYINITPTSYIPTLRFNLSFFSFFLILIALTAVVSFSLFNLFSYLDYYAIKAENDLLRYKLAKVSRDAEDGLRYLEAVKKADLQLQKIMFYDKKNTVLRSYENVGGPILADTIRFSKILSNIDYSKLNEREIIDAYREIKNESQMRIKDYEKLFSYITSKMSMINSIPKGWPVEGYISSSYGYRVHPFTLSYEFHSGVDIVKEPDSDIRVTSDGVVRYTGWAMGYGLCAIVDHGFGYSTLYGHMSQVLVKIGDVVKRGTIIGKLGSTGTSTGPHLHYEVWKYGIPQNPLKYINYNEH